MKQKKKIFSGYSSGNNKPHISHKIPSNPVQAPSGQIPNPIWPIPAS